MSSSRLTLLLVALASAIAGFWLGAVVYSPSSTTNSALSATGSAAPACTSNPARGAAPPISTSQAEATATTVAQFWTTLTMPDEHERFAAWNSLLRQMTAGNAEEVRGLFLKMDAQGRWSSPNGTLSGLAGGRSTDPVP